jgi:hypothetical protein
MQQIGPYALIDRIGVGGMGEIYLARQASEGASGPLIALKLLAPHLSTDRQLVERFIREGDALRQLRHPHIVEIFGTGEANGRHYLAMAYVSGGSLADWLQRRKQAGETGVVPVEDALKITRQIALALDYAHSKGFVHRDVKPANILRGDDGRWMLSDFGLVLMSDRTRLTHSGGFMGTPAYSSPEQAKGLQLDGRSDLYSLGAVLYEMLAGSVPYAAPDTPAMLHAIVHAPVPRLSKIRPEVPSAARRVVETALAKQAEARYQTAGQMVSGIDTAFVGTRRGSGPKAALAEPTRMAMLGGVALVVLLLAIIAIVTTLSNRTAMQQLDTTAQIDTAIPVPTSTPIVVATDTPAPLTEVPTEAAGMTLPTVTSAPPTPELATQSQATAGMCPTAWFFQPDTVVGMCPSESAQTLTAGEQRFEHGRMFWFKETSEIVVLIDTGNGEWQYQVYRDTWRSDMPVRDDALRAPAGRQQPEMGFGKVWRENNLVGQLGWATQAGAGYTTKRQRFIGTPEVLPTANTGFIFDDTNGARYFCAGDAVVGKCVTFVPNSELIFPSVITPTPKPTPCAIANHYPLTEPQQKALGCAADKFVPSRNVVTQQFDNGFLIIFDDARNSNYSGGASLYKIYAILDDGRAWRAYFPNGTQNRNASPNPDDWYYCEAKPGLRPKDSRVPWRGFGMVWCTYPDIRNALGYVRPGADEVPGKAAFQSFEAGRVIDVNGRRYIVFLNFVEGRPDTFLEGRWES